MKNTQVAYIIIGILLSLTPVMAEKYGLIITIGDYPSEGLWPKISSQNDVPLVRSTLRSLAFDERNIFEISDGAATKEGILAAFADLEQLIQPGDIVYIHFSGHGQQVIDDNNDEIDQLDEAIVPYDSPMFYEEGVYQGERLIRDDEINRLTGSIRRRAGTKGQVILVLDSCHSGTGTRGMAKARGTATVMAPDGFDQKLTTIETSTAMEPSNQAEMAPMASFFGASPRELNYETLDDESRPVGSLTFAISKTLSSMREAYSFQELFDHVRTQMKALAPRQHPQWEGPGEVVLLGGEKLPNRDKYSIERWVSSTELNASAGTISSVYQGSLVQIIDSKSNIMATGTVTASTLTESTIVLSTEVDDIDQLLYVRVTELAFPPLQVNVYNEVTATKWQDAISSLESSPIYRSVAENAELYLSNCNNDNAVQIATGDGTVISVVEHNQIDASKHQRQLEEALRRFAQGKFLRSFDNPGSKFDFGLDILVVDCTTGQSIGLLTTETLQIGSCIKFEIKNQGVAGGYFSVLDIQPDNVINVVIPDIINSRTASEYYLKAGQSFTTPEIIEIAQPSGAETLKLLSSREPLDIAGIVASKGNNRRGVGASSSFEQYIASTYNVSTRGARVRKKAGEDIGVKTVYFTIGN